MPAFGDRQQPPYPDMGPPTPTSRARAVNTGSARRGPLSPAAVQLPGGSRRAGRRQRGVRHPRWLGTCRRRRREHRRRPRAPRCRRVGGAEALRAGGRLGWRVRPDRLRQPGRPRRPRRPGPPSRLRLGVRLTGGWLTVANGPLSPCVLTRLAATWSGAAGLSGHTSIVRIARPAQTRPTREWPPPRAAASHTVGGPR